MDNNAFCVMPWLHLHVMPDSKLIPCCVSKYSDAYGDVSKEDLSDIWNNEKFKSLRKKMLAGELPAGCSYCHEIESAGFKSIRNKFNTYFSKYIPDLISQTSPDGKVEEFKVRYLDIRFSNLCNFKCRGCGPDLSSSWSEDYAALSGNPMKGTKVRTISTDSPIFWKQLHELASEVDLIYFGGGEPLITKDHFDLLQFLINQGKTNIELSYSTNLSILTYGNHKLGELWKHFKKVYLYISLDDIGARGEYFRHGTVWPNMEKNLFHLRDEFPEIEKSLSVTVSAYNVYYLPEIFDYAIRERLISPNNFSPGILLNPPHLRIDVLPALAKLAVQKRLNNCSQSLRKNGFTKTADDFDHISQKLVDVDNSHLFPQFLSYTEKLDKLRGESFAETYCELNSFLLLKSKT